MPPPRLQPNIFHLPPPLRLSLRRFLTSKTTQPPKQPNIPKAQPSPSSSSSSVQTRLHTLLSRLPPRLQRYTKPLLSAPKTSIVTFLALHEITAIVPLVGIAGFFHWTGWIPRDWVENEYVREGTTRFGRWFERRGWFGFGDGSGDGSGDKVVVIDGGEGLEGGLEGEGEGNRIVQIGGDKRINVGSNGGRILIEVAMAYAITKVLLPIRIIGSVWATPYVVRWIGGVKGLVKK